MGMKERGERKEEEEDGVRVLPSSLSVGHLDGDEAERLTGTKVSF